MLAAAEAAGVFAFLPNDLISPQIPRTDSLRRNSSFVSTSTTQPKSTSQHTTNPLRSILQRGYQELTHLDRERNTSDVQLIL